jgi:hypothetical protein
MSVEEFRDRDADYLGWVAAHRDGYVINIGRSGQGYARLHRATCGTLQLWEEHRPLPTGGDSEVLRSDRDAHVNRLGNLTL